MKTRMCLSSILLFVCFLEIIIASPVNAVIRIMPLGDSITRDPLQEYRSALQVSYRKALWDLLVAAGYDVDFVGSQIMARRYLVICSTKDMVVGGLIK